MPRCQGPRAPSHAELHADLGGMAMSIIFRILFVLAGAITALFVARDALNFTIIQTFVAVLLVTAIIGAGALWSLRQKS
nr:hypothetical protein BDOA9_0138250 [Bradyrhizobium sp. DOA9]